MLPPRESELTFSDFSCLPNARARLRGILRHPQAITLPSKETTMRNFYFLQNLHFFFLRNDLVTSQFFCFHLWRVRGKLGIWRKPHSNRICADNRADFWIKKKKQSELRRYFLDPKDRVARARAKIYRAWESSRAVFPLSRVFNRSRLHASLKLIPRQCAIYADTYSLNVSANDTLARARAQYKRRVSRNTIIISIYKCAHNFPKFDSLSSIQFTSFA